jgi:murein L,D-transpeptidase YcbB/YkuD
VWVAAGVATVQAALAARPADATVADEVQQAVVRIQQGPRAEVVGEPISSTILLPAFYEDRRFEPAWTPAAFDSLLQAIRDSALDGLDPDDYHLAALTRGRAALAAPATPDAQRAAIDLIATDALVRLGYHARFGKVDQQRIFGNWNFSGPLNDGDPLTLMARVVRDATIAQAIQDLLPHHPFYTALRGALARYRAIAAAGGWQTIAAGPTIKPGGRDARVPALRRRLAAEGDLQDPLDDAVTDSSVLDPALGTALARFQTRHGLEDDGTLGAGTVRALNVPVATRIDQLRISLDRARAVMHALPKRFVLVNVAGFTVYVVDGDWPIWESRVVVGKPYTETPIFRADMTYVVLNPTWTVPPGIMKKEILPGLRRDPNYLAKKGLEWRDGQVVQPAGPKNALGLIKLMFPNPYHVYLHDTPSRTLFAKETRTFSHGCIRVQKPVELAALALDDPAWSVEKLQAAIDTGRTRNVSLTQKLPVLVLYWTATVGQSGLVYLLDDPYGRDKETLAALDAPFSFRSRLLPTRPKVVAPDDPNDEK